MMTYVIPATEAELMPLIASLERREAQFIQRGPAEVFGHPFAASERTHRLNRLAEVRDGLTRARAALENLTPATVAQIPYRVSPRPAGDFAVQRSFGGGRIMRWGTYATQAEADTAARAANATI